LVGDIAIALAERARGYAACAGFVNCHVTRALDAARGVLKEFETAA
jgi:hypothetical protein